MNAMDFDALVYTGQGFNTMDSVVNSESSVQLAQQSLQSIKTMQTPMPDGHLPQEIVLPIFQKQQQKGANVPPVPSQEQFFVALNGAQKGPLTLEQLKGLAIADVIDENSQVWMPGMSDWTDLKTCLGSLNK